MGQIIEAHEITVLIELAKYGMTQFHHNYGAHHLPESDRSTCVEMAKEKMLAADRQDSHEARERSDTMTSTATTELSSSYTSLTSFGSD